MNLEFLKESIEFAFLGGITVTVGGLLLIGAIALVGCLLVSAWNKTTEYTPLSEEELDELRKDD